MYTIIKTGLFTLMASSIISGCNSKRAVTEATSQEANAMVITLTEAQEKNAGLTIITPDSMSLPKHLSVNGIIDVPPQNMVSISFPLGGYLKSTKLLPGMHVKKGEAIAVMEDPQIIQLQQDYLTAKARMGQLENDYKRQEALNATKTTSDRAFELVRSEYQTQRVLIRALQEKLELIGIRAASLTEDRISRSVAIASPIDGFVSAVNVNIGKYVTPAEVLFELVNPEDLHLAITAFEKDLSLLQIGQKVVAHLTNQPDKKHAATIILISKNVDANRSAVVHCHFDSDTHGLLPGMFLQASIEVQSAKGVTIPVDAVVRHGAQEYVFVTRDKHRYERIPVIISLRNNTHVLLDQASGERIQAQNIVQNGAYALLMMMENKAE